VVKGFSFIKNIEESCVYKKVGGSAVVFLILYVDNILLIENDIPILEAVKSSLRKSFSTKDPSCMSWLCTCPDVSYTLSVTSRYQTDYGEAHWTVVKNILKYIRRTKEVFLVLEGEEELIVTGYTNASFQIGNDNSRSQSGFVFYLNEGAVS
jgi:hypothetical protein